MTSYRALWFPIVIAVMIQFIFVVRGVTPVLEGGLYGPDSYMRLVRVGELAESGRWFDGVSMRSNAPYGEELHWSRPFDVLMLAGAALLTPFLGFERALYGWGVLISPALQIAALFALFWAGAPLFERRGRVFLGVVFVCQPGVFYAFMAGRPDHHSLLGLLFVISVGFTLRLLDRPFAGRRCLAAGGVAALAMWVSAEALAPTGLMLAALGAFWIWRGEDFAQKSLVVVLALIAGTALALLLDPPGAGLLAPIYDRFSVVHVVLFTAIALFWAVAAVLQERAPGGLGRGARLLLGVAGVAVLAGGTWALFPKFLGGPYVDVDPRILPLYLDLVEEVQPLLKGDVASLKEVVFWLGAAIPAIPFLVHRGIRGEGGERALWLYLLGAALVFIPLVLYQLRWSTYTGLLLVFPVTGLLMATLAYLDRQMKLPWRAVARAMTVTLFSVGFLFLGSVLKRQGTAYAEAKNFQAEKRECAIRDFAAYAGTRGMTAGRTERILANLFLGPELLYRTPHEVIATPYHRNAAGIFDAHAIMTAAEDDTARAIIARRGITWILICDDKAERILYRTPDSRSTFYRRLTRGALPPWLVRRELPPELGAFRLFEVRD